MTTLDPIIVDQLDGLLTGETNNYGTCQCQRFAKRLDD